MASYPLTWLADVLRDAGCTVVEEGDWKHRGRDGSFTPKAVMLHHDASPKGETSNGADIIINGRPDLAGPLAQLWLDYDGRWHVIAAGRANHAGEGGPWGVVSSDDGNGDCIGIETDHTSDEQWTDSQRSEGIRGVAALCRKLGITTRDEINRAVLAHKEYAPSRKIDPDPLNMDQARDNLYAYLTGSFGMSELDTFSNSKPQTFSDNGEWRTVTVDDEGDLSLLVGPADKYVVHADVTIEPGGPDPIEPGDVVQLRYGTVIDYTNDKPTKTDVMYGIHEVHATSGASFGNLTWVNRIGDSDEASSHKKLRLFVKPPAGKSLTITRVSARVLH